MRGVLTVLNFAHTLCLDSVHLTNSPFSHFMPRATWGQRLGQTGRAHSATSTLPILLSVPQLFAQTSEMGAAAPPCIKSHLSPPRGHAFQWHRRIPAPSSATSTHPPLPPSGCHGSEQASLSSRTMTCWGGTWIKGKNLGAVLRQLLIKIDSWIVMFESLVSRRKTRSHNAAQVLSDW